ncbi:MAG TPA: 1-acyl-sn-glycerol-3-phosphate acyltransferase [Candidatus Marinimicrobia bacterium]|nr:1-acyl-sn-glycerol-3-phosphate acyltransferase [Candidatus Neomarinimicrobiota bacterium]
MNVFYALLALTAIILTGIAIRIIRRVEIHSEETPKSASGQLGVVHTIASVFLYPLGFLGFTVAMLILIPTVVLFSPRRTHWMVRLMARFILLSIGVVVKVRGKEKLRRKKAFVLMFNHESIFDAILLGAVVYRYVTALGAAYQFKLPLWGALLRRWGIIEIPRKKLHAAKQSIEMAKEMLQRGIPVYVAPEGTRTTTGRMREFKKGPFHLVRGAEADILPMVFRGAFQIKRKTDWRLKPGIVHIDVGDFILYEDYRDMSIEELQAYVRKQLRRMKGEIA